MVPMTEYFSVWHRKLQLGLLSDLKRFPLTMPRIDEEVDELPKKMVDHDYVEYNNSSIKSSCQAHSPWLSA
ncbi:unnamed protein product [Brassica oleracea var. botrytis]|uniref:Uncharacterized protein n=1 Tax=Brassica oleracea TaxID=3712 RepID=A0A3P6BKP9_BRAOL|nr:unnamed protein product [Brassica oleracea]